MRRFIISLTMCVASAFATDPAWETGKLVSISRQPYGGFQFTNAWVYGVELPDRRVLFAQSGNGFTGFPKNRLFSIGDEVKLRLSSGDWVFVLLKDRKERKFLLSEETWTQEPRDAH